MSIDLIFTIDPKITAMAAEIETYFKERGVECWKLMGIESRNYSEAANSAQQPVDCARAFEDWHRRHHHHDASYLYPAGEIPKLAVHASMQTAWKAACDYKDAATKRESSERFTQDEVDHLSAVLFHLDKIALSKKFHRIASTLIEDGGSK